MIIRLELGGIGAQYIPGEDQAHIYNVVISSHGLIKIFYFTMPLLIGTFSNFFVPILIGSVDMAYPRLNNISF